MQSRRDFLGAALALGGVLALDPVAATGQPQSRTGNAVPATGQAGQTGPGVGSEAVLPPLPYPYEALEPHIDAETMHLHHGKHHLAYVNGLNAAMAALAAARAQNNFDDIAKLEQQLAFHGSGHVNHVLFWHNMKPAGQAKPQPTGELRRQIERDFGSYEALRVQLQAATVKVEGNGWGVLAWHPFLGKLVTLALLNHQNAQLTGAVPLLLCDVWEHAYYLKYQNRRADFVTAWWNVVDWADVETRFEAGRALRI